MKIPTPAFLVDRSILRRNCERMRSKAARAGIIFRPHVKTHKTAEIARMQHGGVTGPITVSTLAEAKFFADCGFADITYAVPIAPDKLDRAAVIARQVAQFNLLIDSQETLQALERHGEIFDVFLKVDCGYHRAGVDPQAPESVQLAIAIAEAAHVRFRGLLTHAGHAYHAATEEDIRAISEQERMTLSHFRRKLPPM